MPRSAKTSGQALAPLPFWFFVFRVPSKMGTLLCLGFGGLLPLCLYVRGVLPPRLAGPVEKVGMAAAFVGLYSYWIYLWQRVFGCVIFGIVMAKLIEFPALKLRDRIFPPVTMWVTPPPPFENPYEALASSKSA